MRSLSSSLAHSLAAPLLLVLFVLLQPSLCRAEGRLAFLIANSNYAGGSTPFANTANEARRLGEELEKDGFDVEIAANLTKQDMKTALDRFESKIKEGDTVLFFFSGIGLQHNRQNYLIPVDAGIRKELDIKREGFNLDALLSDLAANGAAVRIVIVDAARRNPYERGFREASNGLAAMGTPPGSLILLSASPGKLIRDDDEESGLFINELLTQMHQASSAEAAFTRTRLSVANKSRAEQVPWVSSSLGGEVPLSEGGRAAGEAPGPSPQPPKKNGETKEPHAAGPLSPAGFVFRDCDDCPELVVVREGSFTMGSNEMPSEKPMHTVRISRPFAIGRYEVTLPQWDRCAGARDCRYRPQDQGLSRSNAPAGDLSWDDANSYVTWLSRKTGQTYRLPTEAEWEYAAKGGTSSPFWWGREPGAGNASCAECGAGQQGKPAAVGSFKPNAFGLYDTSGNIAEWVQDCWNEGYTGAPSDGSAWLSGTCTMRVLRGGYFESKAQSVRSAARFRYDSDVRYPGNGFRVVRELR